MIKNKSSLKIWSCRILFGMGALIVVLIAFMWLFNYLCSFAPEYVQFQVIAYQEFGCFIDKCCLLYNQFSRFIIGLAHAVVLSTK